MDVLLIWFFGAQKEIHNANDRTPHKTVYSFSLIRTVTVGFGFSPNLLTRNLSIPALAGLTESCLTAGRELHPAPRMEVILQDHGGKVTRERMKVKRIKG